ncbi:SRPBCC family protein [Kordia sp. YSTF-M3]|uniref:SRPBCC family protein n=1 Tax=Kordia aestuariivivens TaxID=2759037 RepID=A0ABR7Q513_9FLAO|nr:SRPBCC family protein [Kordia aestuariivivens]MBC8753603.1 SRPBCC family protein [Kordia aestuariivivens]
MNLESPKVTVAKSPQELYDFLTNVENFEKLMPESISKFEVLEKGKFLFALKGMPEIILKLKESTPPNQVVLGAASDKLPFTLTGNIQELSAGKSEAQLVFDGDFNPMMGMMIKGPIGKFINTLAENMSKL